MDRLLRLSSALDSIIEFAQAPDVDSWNPITRHKQNKALQNWVDTRPPSAGITAEQLYKKYPGHPRRGLHIAGGFTGAISGGIGGFKLGSKISGRKLGGKISGAVAGSVLGGLAGRLAVGPKSAIEEIKQGNKDVKTLIGSFKDDVVPAKSIKGSPAPIATSHIEVARALKKQHVGFVKRHAAALGTFPIRHSANAAFVPVGSKGVVVTPKNVPRLVVAHEQGHAKDYAHYGGEKGFPKAYPMYGKPAAGFFNRKTYIKNTLLAEERAWKHAGLRSKKDRDLQNAALGTYKRAGYLSAALDNLLEFKAIEIDPKNKGKLKKTEEKTGKSAEELKHSKNPKTRERATFAVNAKKFKHGRKSRAAALSSVLNDIIEFKAIDLGYTYGSSGLCDSPCSSSDQNKKHFPSLYVSDREQEVNLPLSGEAKVKYRMRSKTSRTNEDGQTKHSADIEIQSIDPLTDDKKPKEGGKAKLIGMAVPKHRGLSRGFKRKRTDQGGSIPGDCPGSSSELSINQEVIEFGKAGRLGAIAALVGTLAAGTAERGKIFSKLGIGGKALTSIESAAKPLSPLDALAARSKALAARSTSERMAAAKIHPSATPSQPVQASTPISNQSAIVAADSARKERDAAMAADAARPTPTPDRTHSASGLYDPMNRFRKSGSTIPTTKSRNFAALSASLDEILFDDPRPRNKLGEFNGGQEGGADPNAMSLVYAQGQRKGLHRGLAEGAAAGVGGAVGGTAMKELVASLRKARK